MALRRAMLVVAALFAALACAQDQGLLVPEAQVTYYICFLSQFVCAALTVTNSMRNAAASASHKGVWLQRPAKSRLEWRRCESALEPCYVERISRSSGAACTRSPEGRFGEESDWSGPTGANNSTCTGR